MPETPTVNPWPNNVEFYAPWMSVSWSPENVTRDKFQAAAGEKRTYPMETGRCYWLRAADANGPASDVDLTWGFGVDPSDAEYDVGVPVDLPAGVGGIVRCPRDQDRLGVRFNKAGQKDVAIVLLE